MSEKTKILNKAREVTTKYNISTPTEPTLRNNTLKKLFKSLGKNAYIEPPFISDYGS